MQVILKRELLKEILEPHKQSARTVGFVPTMGALHPGHASLVKRSARENDLTVASIFVNPAQFNNAEDFEKYPKTLEKDLKALEKAGCDIAFVPSEQEMYPREDTRHFSFSPLDSVMEGRYRPGHFSGVAKIVTLLFDLVQPTRAYFGEKDYQQLAIIRRLAKSQNPPLEVIACETVREPDGLAMSSRNMRLSPEERSAAALIPKALFMAKEEKQRLDAKEITSLVERVLAQNPLIKTEYVELCDEETLQPINSIKESEHPRLFVAAYAGSVRLIDNISL